MSRDTTAQVAKLTWILPLVYTFTIRFVGIAIGRVLAEFIAFVLAFLAIPVSIYCLAQIRRHGRKGILGHAVAGLLLSCLFLAIWIPNFLTARDRARAAAKAGEPPPSSYTAQVFHLRTSDKVTPLDGARVSPEFWAVTKVMPVLGRPFVPEEYTASPNWKVVLISNDLWKESFHSDRRTIGREIDLDGVPATIVGILPPGFRFPGRSRLWVPKESEPM